MLLHSFLPYQKINENGWNTNNHIAKLASGISWANGLHLSGSSGVIFNLCISFRLSKSILGDTGRKKSCSPRWEVVSWVCCPHLHSEWGLQEIRCQWEFPKSPAPFARKALHLNQNHTYILQNAPPWVKPVHVDENKKEVDECGNSHEERHLPDESWHQVERLLLFLKGSDGGNDQLMPFLNLAGWTEYSQNC